MKNLEEIKSVIFETECKALLYDGLSLSEPVLTKGDKGLIDNYYLYAVDDEYTSVSEPLLAFGIYSELREIAYINVDMYEKSKNKIDMKLDLSFITDTYIKEYEELYMKIRNIAYRECSDKEKNIIMDYMNHLYHLSGRGLWRNYWKVAPEFYSWVINQGIIQIYDK